MAEAIRRCSPSTKVLVFSAAIEAHYVHDAITAGVAGFVVKDASLETLAQALRTVADGKQFFGPEMAGVLRELLQRSSSTSGRAKLLSHREREVLREIAQGRASKEIAAKFELSVFTVENIRRRIRKLPADTSFRRTATQEDLRKNLSSLISLHNQRWDTRGGSDALRDGRVQDFHRDFAALALDRRWLRLFVLNLGDRPVAAVYAFNYKGRSLYYQAGVAPEYSGMSLGLVALGLSIQDALEEGAVEYDFLHGDEEYKSLWAHEMRELRVFDAYPRSLKGSLTMHSHRVLRAAKTMARYVITR